MCIVYCLNNTSTAKPQIFNVTFYGIHTITMTADDIGALVAELIKTGRAWQVTEIKIIKDKEQ